MHKQSDLFRPFLAETFAHQADLFPDRSRESALACEQCGRYLIETASGYLCCPRGHGRLKIAEQAPADTMDDADLFAEAAEACRARGEQTVAEEFARRARRARE